MTSDTKDSLWALAIFLGLLNGVAATAAFWFWLWAKVFG